MRMNTIFRYVLLMGILIIPLHLSNVANKFPIMIGALVGGTVAFFIGHWILNRKKKKDAQKENQGE